MPIIKAEYLWLDTNQHMRSKTRFFFNIINDYLNPLEYPIWNFDGSSTGQTDSEQTEILLYPVKCVIHPFEQDSLGVVNNVLILCECYDPVTDKPHNTNSRFIANEKFEKVKDKKIWFGIEQEFFFFDKNTKKPFNWEARQEQGEYYCGINRGTSLEREIINEFSQICINCGIQISGYNQEVAHAQWEYQIGPVEGIEAADQAIIAKYIIYRICEKHGLYTSFHPKPIGGDWNGSGCHVNISTEETRNDTELTEITRIIENIGNDHKKWIGVYDGPNNNMRLSGKHETSDPNIFNYGVGTRNTSIRIPNQVSKDGKGYFEDRRPGASIDYYLTLSKYCDYI